MAVKKQATAGRVGPATPAHDKIHKMLEDALKKGGKPAGHVIGKLTVGDAISLCTEFVYLQGFIKGMLEANDFLNKRGDT